MHHPLARPLPSDQGWFAPSPVPCALAPSVNDALADPQGVLSLIAAARGIFFSGGDQAKISNVLDACPDIRAAFHARFDSGCPFGGTSAGAAVMSETMLTGDGGTGPDGTLWPYLEPLRVHTRRGLGLLRHVVVDQHFIIRQRMNRLLSVLASCSERHGLGVDEDVSVAVTDRRYLQV